MKRWIPFCLGVCAVVLASVVPVPVAPSPAQEAHAFSGALWHAATYFVLATLALYAVSGRGGRARLGAVAGVVLLGVCVELAQGTIPYRTASAADAVANAAGASLALAVAAYVTRESEAFLPRKRSLDRE